MVEVVIPWRPNGPDRDRALLWLQRQHRERHPGWKVMLAFGGPGPWVKANALLPAIARTPPGTVIVVSDSDVWCDNLETAVAQVQAGARWAVPHGQVHRLTKAATATVLAGGGWHDLPTVQAPYTGIVGGGIVVARREVILSVPPDPRFVGWGRPGQEDEAWGMALDTLYGPPWRGSSPLLHLWHPPMARASRSRGNPDGWTLKRRYARARRDPSVMMALVTEATDALNVAQ